MTRGEQWRNPLKIKASAPSSAGQSAGLLVRRSVQLSYGIDPFLSTGYPDAPLKSFLPFPDRCLFVAGRICESSVACASRMLASAWELT